jgi:lysyl-tRNA synthetase class I
MKKNSIYNLVLIVLFISCEKTQEVPDFELDNIVKIEIVNKSFRNKDHKRRLEITDLKIIKNVVQTLNYTNTTNDEMNGSGGGLGFIEIRFTNNKGKEIVFNNSYSVYKGVFLVHYEEWDTKLYRNNRFVTTIENLLDTRETIEEILNKVNKVFEEK